MRKIIAAIAMTLAVAGSGTVVAAPASAAKGPHVKGTSAQNSAVYIKGGDLVYIPGGTTLKMICWWDAVGRMFYVQITSGKYKGKYADIHSKAVAGQVSVPHCA